MFDVSGLVTTDGLTLRIIDPGILSSVSGPDFRRATIIIDGKTLTGDIEFHRTSTDWRQHDHHTDRNYNTVILHVVLSGTADRTSSASGRTIPTLILEPYLQSPLASIYDQLAREEYSFRRYRIPCENVNTGIDAALLDGWIHSLYKERIKEKAARFHQRLCEIITHQNRTLGEPKPPYNAMLDPDEIPLPDSDIDKESFRRKLPWEQLLYELLMDGLGFSQNRLPMLLVSERLPLSEFLRLSLIRNIGEQRIADCTIQEIEALLFEVSGLLPPINSVHDQESKVYIHSLYSLLRELPERIGITPLVRTDWIFSPTRPSNFPTIRIAAAAAIVHRTLYGSFFKSLIIIAGGRSLNDEAKITEMLKLLDPGHHPFWNYHYGFTEAVTKEHTLLGLSRKYDLMINVIVPFICLYGSIFGKRVLVEQTLSLGASVPLLQQNQIVETMEKQLVRKKLTISRAEQQQGLLHLYKRYCSSERCGSCDIGKNVFK